MFLRVGALAFGSIQPIVERHAARAPEQLFVPKCSFACRVAVCNLYLDQGYCIYDIYDNIFQTEMNKTKIK